jgi:nucleotide-binding universal stress UspA family protein
MAHGRRIRSVRVMSLAEPITVVGWDGSPAADRALEYALDRLGPGSLCIVDAWAPTSVLRGSEAYPVLAAASLARAEGLVDELPERHRRLGDVAWSARLVDGPPVHALLAAARDVQADEIVVGSRGHGRIRSALGSTAHGLLQHAPCPVTVVPHRARSPLAAA